MEGMMDGGEVGRSWEGGDAQKKGHRVQADAQRREEKRNERMSTEHRNMHGQGPLGMMK